MFKKILIFFIFLFFQSSYLYSREFNYEVYGLNLNFLKIKFNISNNKLYSIINSKGLAGYFIKSQNVIQTTLDKENNIIEGNPDKIKFVSDNWKFTKNVNQKSPNWYLSEIIS